MRAHRNQFNVHLKQLADAIIQMGESVEQAIGNSVEALQKCDLELARQVIDHDPDINAMEERIGEIGTTLIATQQPVAKDLRRILIAFKIAGDLERMADLAVDVAKAAIRLGPNGLIKPLVDIPRMAEIVRQMTNESIQAFTRETSIWPTRWPVWTMKSIICTAAICRSCSCRAPAMRGASAKRCSLPLSAVIWNASPTMRRTSANLSFTS